MYAVLRRAVETYAAKTIDSRIDEQLDRLAKAQVPLEPELFYPFFGLLKHPETRKEIAQLAPYQYELWNNLFRYARVLMYKANKVGITQTGLEIICHLAMLPSSNPLSCRGRNILVIAPSEKMAKDILRRLRNRILDSNYPALLLTRPVDPALRTEKSKAGELYLYNTEDPRHSTRVIGLGINSPG